MPKPRLAVSRNKERVESGGRVSAGLSIEVPVRLDHEVDRRVAHELATVEVGREPPRIKPAYFEQTAIRSDEARRVLHELATPVDDLRQLTRSRKKSGAFELFDPRPVAGCPLIEIDDDFFVPGDPAMLLVRLIGDGVWWRMRLG